MGGEIPDTSLPGLQMVTVISPGLPRHAGVLLGCGDYPSLPVRPASGNPAIPFHPPPSWVFFFSSPVFTQRDLFMLTVFKSPDGGRKRDRVE